MKPVVRIIAATVATFLVMIVAAIFFVTPMLARWSEGYLTDIHQRGVMIELESWERELAVVTTRKEAIHAVEMLDYVKRYYPATTGYQGDPKTTAALESQRIKTLQTIVAALERYSGEKFGWDIRKWEAWRDRQQPATTTEQS